MSKGFKRYCFALDLYDDPTLILAYEEWHTKVWPEVIAVIKESGIESLQIFRVSTRMFMIMEVNDSFSFEHKATLDAASEIVQEWETLMWQFQKPLPFSKPGEKWVLMNEIFTLK